MTDGTENPSGHPSDQGRSSDGSQNPSKPELLPKDQVDKLLNERHSKLDKQIADLTKGRDGLKSSHESLSQRLADFEMTWRQRVRPTSVTAEARTRAMSAIRFAMPYRQWP